MVSFDPTTFDLLVIGFFALAAVGAVTGLAVVAAAVIRHRRTRLARQQTVRTYYRGLVAQPLTRPARRVWQHRAVRHVYECPMRWADMDLLGHVNNVVYVDYLQEARVDMLRTHGPAARTGELAEGVVVVRHEVTYLAR